MSSANVPPRLDFTRAVHSDGSQITLLRFWSGELHQSQFFFRFIINAVLVVLPDVLGGKFSAGTR